MRGMKKAIRVVIADDQRILLDGLRALLGQYDDLVVVGRRELKPALASNSHSRLRFRSPTSSVLVESHVSEQPVSS